MYDGTNRRIATEMWSIRNKDQASLALVAATTRPSLADRQLGISQFIIPSLDRVTNYSMGGAEAGATVEADNGGG